MRLRGLLKRNHARQEPDEWQRFLAEMAEETAALRRETEALRLLNERLDAMRLARSRRVEFDNRSHFMRT